MNTIAAISTAMGAGGIGIIRMSGKECFDILDKIFEPAKKENIDKIKGYSIKYGYIVNKETNEKIDEVLVSYFKSPKSYTTEDMCEINSHGGIVVEKEILELCIKNGAILAEPGEFTKRAFLNGRMDLAQAESVMDLINSKTSREAKASINQLKGGLSKEINLIKKQLLDIMADIEATIDYPEYDIENVTQKSVEKKLKSVKEELEHLEKSFDNGKILRDGVKTVIIGKPNTGKSSLLNLLLKEDRAIVSEIEGTTRDTIEEYISINGIPIKIVDTAGIRNTSDKIEKIGVEKAINLIDESDLIIAIFDNSNKLEEDDEKILELIKNKNAIILLNKIDKEDKINDENKKIASLNKKTIKISTKTKNGLNELYDAITEMFDFEEIEKGEETVITNIRHKNQISMAIKNVINAIKTIDENMPIDIIAIYIKQILEDLSKITGDNVSEDIINEIFSKFCLGK